MDKIAREVAEQEVQKWLDYKKVKESKVELYKENVKSLVEAIMDGTLVLGEGCVFTHTLKFPLEGEKSTTTLTYKPRIKVSTVHAHLQGVKPNDADGRVTAHIAALTSLPKDVIKALDTEDYSLASDIAIFFL